MPFVPKGHEQKASKDAAPEKAPPSLRGPRKITKQSIDSLFAQLSQLQSYLASTDDTMLSPEQLDEYRVNAPDYHGEDNSTKQSGMGAAIFGS